MQHRKEKPWDHDGIDHWAVAPFKKEENPTGVLEESAFAVLFPKYRGAQAEKCLFCNSLQKIVSSMLHSCREVPARGLACDYQGA